jgi:hypothetical protein
METINKSDTSVDLDISKSEKAELEVSPTIPPSTDDGPHFDAQRTKALLRKLDWHLVPFLALLYLYAMTVLQPSPLNRII